MINRPDMLHELSFFLKGSNLIKSTLLGKKIISPLIYEEHFKKEVKYIANTIISFYK
jgi:hypothetical protein